MKRCLDDVRRQTRDYITDIPEMPWEELREHDGFRFAKGVLKRIHRVIPKA